MSASPRVTRPFCAIVCPSRVLESASTPAATGRSKCVYATAAGIELITGLDSALAELNETIFAPLSKAERAALRALLDKIDAQLA
ncbi:MarR family winged helix-turn-helix transcriptional regulator [Nocardia miyunensis]|uniref:MarR family winged helix-turn-helix transcriptional regulator n=1 Tax=Nocardia miyunensis TaxID=282684 RepID=UPI0012F51330|nr:MarR family winged helix-turn-helix transcriptional regulator [Nocardia miyunensis]